MIQAFLKERYDIDQEIDFDKYLKEHQLSCHKTDYGFVTYKFEGDAAFIYDLYVKPEFRRSSYAWLLHNFVIEQASALGKRVAITFSSFQGKNHMDGIHAMKAAGFIPAYKTNKQFMFIKGI